MHPRLGTLTVVFFVTAATAASPADAQMRYPRGEGYPPGPSQQFDASRFDSLTAVTLRSILDDAKAKGLPTAPLVNRALEGAARKVVGSRIVAVVRAHADAMEEARTVLGARAGTSELDACATAMRAGVDRTTMAHLHTIRTGATIIKPCVVLTDILQRGIPISTANEAVLTISRLPRADAPLDSLQSLVAKNVTRGGQGMAVEAIQRYLREVAPTSQDTSNGSRPPDS